MTHRRAAFVTMVVILGMTIGLTRSAESCYEPLPVDVDAKIDRLPAPSETQGDEPVIALFQLTLFRGEAFGAPSGERCGCSFALPSSFFGPGRCVVDAATITDENGAATPFGTFSPNSATANSFATEIENQLGPDALTDFSLFGFATVLSSSVPAGTGLRLVFDITCPQPLGDSFDRAAESLLGSSAILGTGPLKVDDTLDTAHPEHIGISIVTVPSSKCTRSIAKETSKYAKARAKALQKCEEAKIKDTYVGTCPDGGAPDGSAGKKAAEKIATATTKLGAKIANKCGGADKTCGTGDKNDLDPLAAGFPEECPNLENGSCNNALDDCGDIAQCIQCVTDAAIDQVMTLAYGNLTDADPDTQSQLNACQRAIGKETTKFLLAKEKIILKCWDKALKGQGPVGPGADKVGSDACPDVAGTAGGAAQKAALKLAKAESKKVVKICKACGGASGLCDLDVDTSLIVEGGGTVTGLPGPADDLSVAAIGFAASCPDVTLPFAPGTACASLDDLDGTANVVDTLRELILCVDCVTEFKVDCLDRTRVPDDGRTEAPVPAECNP